MLFGNLSASKANSAAVLAEQDLFTTKIFVCELSLSAFPFSASKPQPEKQKNTQKNNDTKPMQRCDWLFFLALNEKTDSFPKGHQL